MQDRDTTICMQSTNDERHVIWNGLGVVVNEVDCAAAATDNDDDDDVHCFHVDQETLRYHGALSRHAHA